MSAFTNQFTKLDFPLMGLVRFPTITISDEDRAALGLKPTDSNRECLRQLAWKGYLEREAKGKFKGISRQQVVDRFKVEFATFDKTGVVDYLLLVWDICRWADQQGIVRGWGRGSAGGSLTNYCLGIVNVNPLRHNLDFPRFLSEARMKPIVKDGVIYVDGKSAPDIDLDFQYLRRDDVIRYIEFKYPGRTSKISTRMELTGKMALKDTLKTYAGYSEEQAKQVSDKIETRFGKVQSLHEAEEKNEDIQAWLKDPEHVRIYRIAQAMEGLCVGKGQHPSGVFISYEPLDGNIPIELSKTKEAVTSFDMETVAGLAIKVDCLAVRSLDLVAGVAKRVGISLDDIDVEDPLIYEYLRTHDTYQGLFQIAEGTTKEATLKIKPRHIEDLVAILAISRPGGMKYIDQFAAYVKTGEIKPFYPSIDKTLLSTGGALIMQEQITEVCRDVFGMSGVDADCIRHAVGKKRRDEMAKWEPVIRANGKARGIPEDIIQSFWDTCSASADYLFNKSHSAAYVSLTAATIYLKAKYPQAFYLEMLRLSAEEPNPIEYMNGVIAEMRASGIQLLPPDLLKSESDFSIQDGHVRFGLSNIKGISTTTMAKITSFKRDFDSKFAIFEAAKSAKIDIRTLSGLIYCGCLDSIIKDGSSRAKLALEAQLYNLLTANEKLLARRYADEFNHDLLTLIKGIGVKTNEKGKLLIRESRMETLRRDYADYWDQYRLNAANEQLSSYLHERHYLGFSYTNTLHAVYSSKVVGLTPVKDLPTIVITYKEPAKVVAFVGEGKLHVSAKGDPYWRGTLLDDSGTILAMLFGSEKLESCRARNGDIPKEGAIIIGTGSMSKDKKLFFLESMIEQVNPIKPAKKEVPI